MKVSPPARLRARLIPSRLAGALFVASALSGCHSSPDASAERAMRARQMRDVSRMLDAMETPGPSPAIPSDGVLAPPATSSVGTIAGNAPRNRPTRWLIAIVTGTVTPLAAFVAWRIRRRRVARARGNPSDRTPISARRATRMPPTPTACATPLPTPTPWVYQTSPFETPLVHRIDEPVDLLLPLTTPTGDSLLMRLDAIDASPALHLVGDPRFPDIRRVGDGVATLDAWHDILKEAARGDDEDAHLARWLWPALLVLRSRDLPRREAERLLDEAAMLTQTGIDHATDDERGHWTGRAIRIELARIERLSGATRLFALRGLQARQCTDLGADVAPVLDAWIDVQLAWGSWLLGGGAAARHAEAEALCDALGRLGPQAYALSLRRRAEISMCRAETEKSPRRLAHLDRAQALFEEAYGIHADAGTALMLARCARLRALALPAAEAADACATALTHAFVAEQDPAWRLDALECRLAIQLTYEALPGRAVQGEVAASLGRELAAMDAHSVGARTAMAATRLREGDFAGASALCEAAWRSGGADRHLLALWRDACRGWTDTADSTGHDRHALAHAVRQLAIARATL